MPIRAGRTVPQTATPLTDRERIRLVLARTSFRHFCDRMFPGYIESAHTRELTDILQQVADGELKRVIFTYPPRHSKSLHVSENLPVYFLGNNPDKRVIAASNGDDLAIRFSRLARGRVLSPDWPFPEVQLAPDSAQVKQWDIADHRGGYFATGRGSAVVGHGADLVIVDDPFRGRKDADSKRMRDEVEAWYYGSLRTRLEPGGAIVVTSTRWHHDDLTGRLLRAMDTNGEQWTHIHRPALNADNTPLWPERWTTEQMIALRDSMPAREWNAQYMGKPTSETGGMFHRQWWRYWQYPGMNLPPVPVELADGTIVEHPVLDLPNFWQTHLQSWDMNFKKTETGSYVAGLVGGVQDRKTWLLDCFRERVGFDSAAHAVVRMSRKWPDAYTKLIEAKANGPAIMDHLTGIVPGMEGVDPYGTKEARANAITPAVRAGDVVLPHPDIASWSETLVDECAEFPLGTHNDLVDTLSQLVRHVVSDSGGASGQDILDAYLAQQGYGGRHG